MKFNIGIMVMAGVICHAATVAGQPTTGSASTSIHTTSTAPAAFEKFTTRALVQGKVPGVKFRADVAYLGPDRAEKMDVYEPADAKAGVKRPAIVMIHGGGWTGGDKQAARELQMGTTFARAGYVAVSINYQMERSKRWPQNLMDCKNAVRWVRANAQELHVDVDNIGVIGGSAGGHLSLMVAYTSGVDELEPKGPYPGVRDDVQACVDLYGIADLKVPRIRGKTPNRVGKKWGLGLLNEEQQKDQAQWKLGSPVDHITSATPPTLILHGDADVTVDVEQSKELAKALEAAGVEHKLIVLHGAPHTFLLHDKRLDRDLRGDVLAFFNKHLKN